MKCFYCWQHRVLRHDDTVACPRVVTLNNRAVVINKFVQQEVDLVHLSIRRLQHMSLCSEVFFFLHRTSVHRPSTAQGQLVFNLFN